MNEGTRGYFNILIKITKNLSILILEFQLDSIKINNNNSHETSVDMCGPSSANEVKKIRVLNPHTVKSEWPRLP